MFCFYKYAIKCGGSLADTMEVIPQWKEMEKRVACDGQTSYRKCPFRYFIQVLGCGSLALIF